MVAAISLFDAEGLLSIGFVGFVQSFAHCFKVHELKEIRLIIRINKCRREGCVNGLHRHELIHLLSHVDISAKEGIYGICADIHEKYNLIEVVKLS